MFVIIITLHGCWDVYIYCSFCSSEWMDSSLSTELSKRILYYKCTPTENWTHILRFATVFNTESQMLRTLQHLVNTQRYTPQLKVNDEWLVPYLIDGDLSYSNNGHLKVSRCQERTLLFSLTYSEPTIALNLFLFSRKGGSLGRIESSIPSIPSTVIKKVQRPPLSTFLVQTNLTQPKGHGRCWCRVSKLNIPASLQWQNSGVTQVASIEYPQTHPRVNPFGTSVV